MQARIRETKTRLKLATTSGSFFAETNDIICESIKLLDGLSSQMPNLSEEEIQTQYDTIVIGTIVLSLVNEIEIFKKIIGYPDLFTVSFKEEELQRVCKLRYLYPYTFDDLIKKSGLIEISPNKEHPEEEINDDFDIHDSGDIKNFDDAFDRLKKDIKSKQREKAKKLAKAQEFNEKINRRLSVPLQSLIPIIGHKVLIEKSLKFDRQIFLDKREVELLKLSKHDKKIELKEEDLQYTEVNILSDLLSELIPDDRNKKYEKLVEEQSTEKQTSLKESTESDLTGQENDKEDDTQKAEEQITGTKNQHHKMKRYLGRTAAIFAAFVPPLSLPFMIYKEVQDRRSNIIEPLWKTVIRCVICAIVPGFSGYAVWKWVDWAEKVREQKNAIHNASHDSSSQSTSKQLRKSLSIEKIVVKEKVVRAKQKSKKLNGNSKETVSEEKNKKLVPHFFKKRQSPIDPERKEFRRTCGIGD